MRGAFHIFLHIHVGIGNHIEHDGHMETTRIAKALDKDEVLCHQEGVRSLRQLVPSKSLMYVVLQQLHKQHGHVEENNMPYA